MRKVLLMVPLLLLGCVHSGVHPLRPQELATAPYRDTEIASLTGSLLYEGSCLLFRDDETKQHYLPDALMGFAFGIFVAAGDRFEPRPVVLGAQLAERVEIRQGLNEGEQIVAAGVFLLDSESRLRATGGTGGHAHGATSGEQPTPATPHTGHRE